MNTHCTDCATARMYLSARHDREEPHDVVAAAGLARHLAACDGCRAFEVQLAGLAPLFNSLRELAPPPDLARELAAHARSQSTMQDDRSSAGVASRSPWVLRVAAGLLGFLSIFSMDRLGRDAPPADDSTLTLDRFARAGRAFRQAPDFRALPEREILLHVSQGTGDPR